MNHAPTRAGLVAVGVTTLAFSLFAGCGAEEASLPPAPVNPTGNGGGTTTATGTGAMGGQGGVGGDPSPCGMDCSMINAPQCFKAVCNTGMHPGPIGSCVVVEDDDGLPCEDGEFCTVDDTCQAGVCTGGDPNDCGMQPAECHTIVCDENDELCEEEIIPNGDPCDPNDLCVNGATCTNGLCGGGTTEDCFLEPVPNDCHVSVCNPSNGQCEPVPGNEGATCTDLNDLCTVDKTCTAGSCTGGMPKDCSAVAAECEVGVCDTNNGQCGPMASMDGDPCDDLDACTVNTTCSSGSCLGGTTVTMCSQTADGCCPGACTPTNDIDCACGLDKLDLEELHLGSDYVIIHNPTTCTLDLAGIEIFFDDSRNVDFTANLSSFMLAAGASVVVTEDSTPPAGQIYTGGNIPFSNTRAGAVYLCDGPCSVAANVVDLIVWEGSSAAPPILSGLTFTPSPMSGITNESTQSFLRVASTGQAPNWFQADWSVGPKTQ